MNIPKSYEALAADLASEKIISKTLQGQKEAYMMIADKGGLDLSESKAREAALREELALIIASFDELAACVDFSEARLDQTGDSPIDCANQLKQRLTVAEQWAEHWRSVASEATCRAAGLNALASSAIPRLPTVEMLDELTNGDTSKRKVMKLRWAQMLKVLPQEADPEPMGTSTTMDDGSIKTVLKNGLTTIVRDGQLEKVLAPADWTVKPNHVERAQVESSCICVDYVKFPPVNGAPEADGGRVVSEELKKAVALLESIKAQILEHHERGSYFATIMVLNTLPEISQLLREIKS